MLSPQGMVSRNDCWELTTYTLLGQGPLLLSSHKSNPFALLLS